MSYIIVGDTKEHKACLICVVCGGKEYAEKLLERMKKAQTDRDKEILKTHTNLRIKQADHGQWDDEYRFLTTM